MDKHTDAYFNHDTADPNAIIYIPANRYAYGSAITIRFAYKFTYGDYDKHADSSGAGLDERAGNADPDPDANPRRGDSGDGRERG